MSPPPVSLLDRAIGKMIVQFRAANDLSQHTFALEMNSAFDIGAAPTWSQSTVAKVEAGKRSITLLELLALSHVLNKRVDILLNEAVFYLENE